ncbi:MAG: hypothetical protein LBL66_02775, partial [Clostridiales bacterium]|nr:hypothetical protein [Clostridiales bacterium]
MKKLKPASIFFLSLLFLFSAIAMFANAAFADGLDDAKTAAKAELASYKSQSAFYELEWSRVQKAVVSGGAAIDGAADEEAVAAALTAAKQKADYILTKTERDAKPATADIADYSGYPNPDGWAQGSKFRYIPAAGDSALCDFAGTASYTLATAPEWPYPASGGAAMDYLAVYHAGGQPWPSNVIQEGSFEFLIDFGTGIVGTDHFLYLQFADISIELYSDRVETFGAYQSWANMAKDDVVAVAPFSGVQPIRVEVYLKMLNGSQVRHIFITVGENEYQLISPRNTANVVNMRNFTGVDIKIASAKYYKQYRALEAGFDSAAYPEEDREAIAALMTGIETKINTLTCTQPDYADFTAAFNAYMTTEEVENFETAKADGKAALDGYAESAYFPVEWARVRAVVEQGKADI